MTTHKVCFLAKIIQLFSFSSRNCRFCFSHKKAIYCIGHLTYVHGIRNVADNTANDDSGRKSTRKNNLSSEFPTMLD